MLHCGLREPCRATGFVVDFGRNLGWLRRSILHVRGRLPLGTVSAAEESPADFGSVTYDFRAAMLQERSDRLNCALEAVKKHIGILE